jgi:hypothetical protein
MKPQGWLCWIVALVLAVACSSLMPPSTSPPSKPSPTPNRQDVGYVFGRVTDQETDRPIRGAVVYVGRGQMPTHTDVEGKYQLELSWGSFSFSVFKKGYVRSQQSGGLERGQRVEVNVAIAPLDTPPQTVELIGTLRVRVIVSGTKSEYSRVELDSTELGQPVLLFDETGESRPAQFAQWDGKQVRLQGFYEIGFVRWDKREERGIYVEDIALAP